MTNQPSLDQLAERAPMHADNLRRLRGMFIGQIAEDHVLRDAAEHLEDFHTANQAQRERLAQHEKDLADAAVELPVPLPEPGTIAAKMLRANLLLRAERQNSRRN